MLQRIMTKLLLLLLLVLMLSQDKLMQFSRPLRVQVQIILLERLHVLPASNVLSTTSRAIMREEGLAVVAKVLRHRPQDHREVLKGSQKAGGQDFKERAYLY